MVVKVCNNPVALGLGTGRYVLCHSRGVGEKQKERRIVLFVTICQMAVLCFG